MLHLKPYKKYIQVDYDYVKQLPDEWQLLPNIAIFEERMERGHETEELLSVTIGRGVIKQTELDKKDSSTADKSKYLLVYPGDLVYSMRLRQGASGLSNYIGIVSPACTVLKPRKNIKLNPKFYHYMLRSGFYKNYVERFSYGIADGQIPLRYTDFKRMYSIIPPFEVQNAIVEYLDKKTATIDKFIRNKENLIELLEERKKKLITKNISQWKYSDLEYSGIDWVGNIPKHWKVLNLKYLLKSKLKYGANEEAQEANQDHPRYIRITDFGFNGKLNDETFRSLPYEKAKEYLLCEGDILFARSGATVGKTYQFKNYKGIACFAGYLIKASPNEKKILSDFLYLYTQSSLFGEWKNRIFDKATIENIGADKYSILKVIVPSIEEQTKIIIEVMNGCSEVDLAISKAHKEIDTFKEYRESLITNVITGKMNIT